MYKNIVKRLIDILGSLILLTLFFPLILVISIILFVDNNGSPFFLQLRPGRHEKLFRIVKFKTMNDNRDENGQLLPNNQRITPLGKWLRTYSLDEIPQLFNVLIGDMSMIGPRPLLTEYLKLYNSHQAKRHLVRPGITGWAQVNGRNAISWEEKFDKDVYYVDHLSMLLDIKIIWLTLLKVFRGSDVNYSADQTMPKFKGNPTRKETKMQVTD